jgi:hypothetical protein
MAAALAGRTNLQMRTVGAEVLNVAETPARQTMEAPLAGRTNLKMREALQAAEPVSAEAGKFAASKECLQP